MRRAEQQVIIIRQACYLSALLMALATVAQSQVKQGLNTVRGAVGTYQQWTQFSGFEPEVIGDSIDWDSWDSIKNSGPTFLADQWDWYPDKSRFVFALAMFPIREYPSGTGDFDRGIAGDFDHVFAQAAQTLISRGFGNSTLRLAWEFNGFWMPWYGETTDRQSKFRAYWQRIHSVVMAQPGANFSWDWNANVSDQTVDATAFYPGDAYVDFIGIDLYDVHGFYYWDKESLSPLELMRVREIVSHLRFHGFQGAGFFRDFARQHNKPFSISEWGVWDTSLPHGIVGGNDNPYYIRRMYDWIRSNDVFQESYFELHYGDGASHSLLDGSHPESAAMFNTLFHQQGFPDGPALPIVDGDLVEWGNEHLLVTDPADAGATGIDIRKVYITHGAKKLYIAYEHTGTVPYQWNWLSFLDTDADSTTGLSGQVGADYMIQGNSLYLYSGTNGEWNWSYLSAVEVGYTSDGVEIAVPLDLLESPVSFEFAFYGDNQSHNASSDMVPEYSLSPGYLLYEFNRSGNIPSLDGHLSDWPGPTQVATDADDVSGSVDHVDIRSISINHTRNHVYVGYESDGGAALDDAWLFFIDTDSAASTGYAVFSMGAEYMIQNRLLYRYHGSGNDWNWQLIDNLTAASGNGQVEIAFSRAAIGNPSAFDYLFFGDNLTFHPGSSWFDLVPDDAWFSSPTYHLSPVIDGSVLDWLASEMAASDIGENLSGPNTLEFAEIFMTDDADRLYIACRTTQFGFPDAAWQCYFDTDRNGGTGFPVSDIGAELRLVGSTLERYQNGTWEYVANVPVASGGATAEFSIDRSYLEDPLSFDWVLQADNSVYGGTLVDSVPDAEHGFYRF